MPKNSDKSRDENELVQFKLRIREGLRAQIEQAASESGSSMNSEIAERLMLSLRDDELLQSGLRPLLVDLALQITRAEDQTGKRWNEDLATFMAAERLISDALRKARPKSDTASENHSIRAELGALAPRYRELRSILEDCGIIEQERSIDRYLGNFSANAEAMPENRWHQPGQQSEQLTESEKTDLRELLDEWQKLNSLHQRVALTEKKAAQKYAAEVAAAEAEGQAIYETITGQREVDHGA